MLRQKKILQNLYSCVFWDLLLNNILKNQSVNWHVTAKMRQFNLEDSEFVVQFY